MAASSDQINNHAAFIWSVADLLRGDYKQSEYGRVILPLTVLRRLDCVLDQVKPAMLEEHERVKGKVGNFGPLLDKLTDIPRRQFRGKLSPRCLIGREPSIGRWSD